MTTQADGKPVLKWEMLNTVREEDGLLSSRYMTERAKILGGWLVIAPPVLIGPPQFSAPANARKSATWNVPPMGDHACGEWK